MGKSKSETIVEPVEDEAESDIVIQAQAADDKQRRREERARDVSSYQMPDDLEAAAGYYESDDPAFITHVRRAEKYHSSLAECSGKVWTVDVKGHDSATDKYSRLFFCRRAALPTPEECRESGVSGRFCFVLRYFDPFKVNRTTPGAKRGGVVVIQSGDFEIPVITPGRVMQPGGAAQPIAIPPAPQVDAFAAIFAQAQAILAQAAGTQMEILSNRSKIAAEGVEMGRMMQRVEERERQIDAMLAENTRLREESAAASRKLSAIALRGTVDDDEEEPPSGIDKLVDFAREIAPAVLQKYGFAIPGVTDQGAEEGPTIPPQP